MRVTRASWAWTVHRPQPNYGKLDFVRANCLAASCQDLCDSYSVNTQPREGGRSAGKVSFARGGTCGSKHSFRPRAKLEEPPCSGTQREIGRASCRERV